MTLNSLDGFARQAFFGSSQRTEPLDPEATLQKFVLSQIGLQVCEASETFDHDKGLLGL